jgi:hypothetical protein
MLYIVARIPYDVARGGESAYKGMGTPIRDMLLQAWTNSFDNGMVQSDFISSIRSNRPVSGDRT